MKLKGVSEKVFLDRYALKSKKGDSMENDTSQMWQRVAKGIAKEEKPSKKKHWEKEFNRVMQDFKYVPGGRVLAGAGTGYDVTYYNCYVIPNPPDSRNGILENLGHMVEIMAHGGGVGVNLSSLRPRGARVSKVNGYSSGPVNWAELYSVATHDIIQQGGSRRGALMIMLWDWHPDIQEFINVKRDLTRIRGANLSVCVSDKFMEAVKNDEDWEFIYPDIKDPKYDKEWDGYMQDWLDKGGKVNVHGTIPARELWDQICQAAWNSAEPGVVFMERYNKWHNNYYFNRINCVNPCGEEGLPPWGVCNLGSINLAAFVNEEGEIDYPLLEDHVKVAVRFQDNVIDGDVYIFEGIRKAQLEGERRIGIGTMGLADALIKMKIRYGSEEALVVIDKLYKLIRDAAYEASADLAAEKGAFPKFQRNKYLNAYFIKKLPKHIRAKISKHGVRNSVILMQAPTGSTSLMVGVSSGIEPVFEFSFTRRDRLGEHKIYHPLYDNWRKDNPGVERPDYFVSAADLTPLNHVRVQAAIQKYVDASISKTVNAPADFTVDDVKELYSKAYELGCKGITFMREGSRPGVLERETDAQKKQDKPEASQTNGIHKDTPTITRRPLVLQGATYKMQTPVGKSFITVNTDPAGEPSEVFINIGKGGTDISAMAEAMGRLISLVFRMNAPVGGEERVRSVLYQLGGIGGRSSTGFGKQKVLSLPDALSKVLGVHFNVTVTNGSYKVNGNVNGYTNGYTEAHKEEKTEEKITPLPAQLMMQPTTHLDICPDCGDASLAHEEGCKKCYSCGYSEC